MDHVRVREKQDFFPMKSYTPNLMVFMTGEGGEYSDSFQNRLKLILMRSEYVSDVFEWETLCSTLKTLSTICICVAIGDICFSFI